MATTTPLNAWPVPTSTDYVAQGAVAIEALGDAIDASVGSGLLAWQTWAPVLSGGWANGNGVWNARYAKIGKIVHVAAFFTIGSTTTKGTGMTISLPLTAANSARQTNGYVYATIGVNTYPLGLQNSSTGNIQATTWAANGTYVTNNSVTSTTPATWATNDIIYFGLTYEVA
jgi:hypothetical protein